jgi:hypothetical protein
LRQMAGGQQEGGTPTNEPTNEPIGQDSQIDNAVDSNPINDGVDVSGQPDGAEQIDYKSELEKRDAEIERLRNAASESKGLSSEIAALEKSGAGEKEIKEYISLRSSEFTDEQAIKKNMQLSNPSLTTEEVDSLFDNEFGKHEGVLRSALIKQRAVDARSGINEFLQKYQVKPSRESNDPNNVAQMADYKIEGLKLETLIKDKQLGDVPFEFAYDQSEVESYAKQVYQHYASQGGTPTVEQVKEGVSKLLSMNKTNDLIAAAIHHGIAIGRKGRVERSSTAAPLSGNPPSPQQSPQDSWLDKAKRAGLMQK